MIVKLLLVLAFSICLSVASPLKPATPQPRSLIVPGMRVGPLFLGESPEKFTRLFPSKLPVEESTPVDSSCGTRIDFRDSGNPRGGNLVAWVRDGKVFQLDAATDRYHTPDGITVLSSPSAVRHHYRGLRSYVLSQVTYEAIGMRPLAYWVNEDMGIAFAFAYSRSAQRRYVYKVIVFNPGSEICVADTPRPVLTRRELAPYSLEP